MSTAIAPDESSPTATGSLLPVPPPEPSMQTTNSGSHIESRDQGAQSRRKSSASSSSPCSEAHSVDQKVSDTQQDELQKTETQEVEYLHGIRLVLLMLALVLAVLIMALDISIVATAMPRITDTFNTITDIGWYASAFSFTNAACQPMAGKIYTFFPMKVTFIAYIALFEVGSLLCATSVSSAMFIIGRAVAGIGSSGLVNGALSIVALAGPPEQRPMFMGFIMSIAGAGQLLGPLIGGALTQSVTWRWCFYINLPLGAVTILVLILIRFPSEQGRRKQFVPQSIIKDFDVVGFALFVPAIIMFMMALQWGGTKYAWNSATIIGLLVGFFVALFPLSYWEYRQGSDAMFPLPLLKIRPFYSACITGFLAGASLLIIGYYLPLWFQTVKLADPLHSAIYTLPSFLSQLLFAMVSGATCPRFVPYLTPYAITGAILATIGCGLLTILTPSTGTGEWIGFQILTGVGRGLVLQVPVQVAQQHISKKDLPVGTAVVSFFQFFGGAIFLGFGQTAFANILKSQLSQLVPGLDASVVLGSGATDVRANVPAQYLEGVKLGYSNAVTRTFYLSVATSALGLVTAFGLGWKKIEKKTPPPRPGVKKEETEAVEKV